MNGHRMARMLLLALLIACGSVAVAQDAAPPAQEVTAPAAETAAAPAPAAQPADATPLAAEKADEAPQTVTLMGMIQQGGAILWVIMILGFIGFVMTVYFFLTVTPKREVPQSFVKRAFSQVRSGDLRGAYQMCEGRDELLVNVFRAGLKMSGHDRYVIQDAMESEGERGATALWQKISWLNSIGTIAPLLGLLGTVWGMILAFSAIAYDNSKVKSITMADSVSKAMITTAGGLVLAIPVLLAYFYLRGRVIKIIADVEAHSSELVELLTRGQDQ